MFIIPLQPVPNQSLQVQLNGQSCTINVVQYAYGLFVTLYVGDTLIIASVLAEDFNRIVRSEYLGFVGDLAFVDAQGTTDPVYTGFGTEGRYQLVYFLPEELT